MGVPDETLLFAVTVFSCRFVARGWYVSDHNGFCHEFRRIAFHVIPDGLNEGPRVAITCDMKWAAAGWEGAGAGAPPRSSQSRLRREDGPLGSRI